MLGRHRGGAGWVGDLSPVSGARVGRTAHDGFSPNGAFLRAEPLQPSDALTGLC